jgi:hypothetical protein
LKTPSSVTTEKREGGLAIMVNTLLNDPPVDHGQKPGGLFTGLKARLVRNILSYGMGIAIAKYQNNVWYVSAAPLLQTFGKWLRDKYPGDWEWLPF